MTMRYLYVLFALVSLTACQSITPPAQLPGDHVAHLERRQSLQSDATDTGFSSRKLCYVDEPACTNQLSRYDECTAEYGIDPKYQYCLCTKGWQSLGQVCDDCQIEAGIMTDTTLYSSSISSASSHCASLSNDYGNGSSNSSDYSPIGVYSWPNSFTGTETITSSVSIPTGDFLSGLVADQPTASPTLNPGQATPTNAASRMGGLSSFSFSMLSWVVVGVGFILT